MKVNKGYKSVPLSFQRKAVIASATVTHEKNTIHCISEIDISIPRKILSNLKEDTGESQSFTAYIISALALTIKKFPELNSFIKRNKIILLDDINISVLVEREIENEKVPEPMTIKNAQKKSYENIRNEIKKIKLNTENTFGSISNSRWFSYIPTFFLKSFVKIADQNISMAKKYGKIAVTAVGMFGNDSMWFIPHGSTTVLITVGSMSNRVVEENGKFISKEFINITASFDHNIIDGAPAARFMSSFAETIKSADFL